MDEKTFFDELKNVTATYDPALDKYTNVVLFPKKLEEANETLRNTKLPPNFPNID
jgi:hypothetical protein